MSTQTQGPRACEFLLSEAPGTLSREEITIVSGSGVVEPGTVLAVVTATGKYAPYEDAAADGTETAAGVLIYQTDATSADQSAVAIVRLAEVIDAKLIGSDTNGLADLAALNIIARS